MYPRAVAGVVSLLALAACYAVRPVRAPGAYIAANEPLQVWVVVGDSLLEVERPQVLGDTLVGFASGAYREFAFAGLGEVRVRRFDVGGTVAVLAAIVVGFGLLGVLMRRRRPRPVAPGAASSRNH